jgi:hypothetical protein
MARELRKDLLTQSATFAPQRKTMSTPLLSKSERTRIVWTVIAAVLLIIAASVESKAAELNPKTVNAWDDYVQAQNVRVAESSQAAGLFLWSDQSPDRISRLREGEILVAPMGDNPKVVPHGLIHHWIGAVFLPNMNLDEVLKVVRDYDNYKEFYAPNVKESRLLHRAGTNDAFSLLMLNKAVVAKFALDAEFENSYAALDNNRWYSVAYSTRIREIEEYGQADQHALAPNTGHGFIWRLYNVSRFEQRDGGVYVELETVALSRDVPTALRWVVNPVVRRVSKGSLLVSLQKTQEAVLTTNGVASRGTRKDQEIEAPSVGTNKALVTAVNNGLVSRKAFGPSNNK